VQDSLEQRSIELQTKHIPENTPWTVMAPPPFLLLRLRSEMENTPMAIMGIESLIYGGGRHRIDSALFYYLPCPRGRGADAGVLIGEIGGPSP
jgi:hypothetical protein